VGTAGDEGQTEGSGDVSSGAFPQARFAEQDGAPGGQEPTIDSSSA
jgi:hypothetical protein